MHLAVFARNIWENKIMQQTRRDFLKTSTLFALAPTIPGFLAQTARAAKVERDGRVLVVIQLDGGQGWLGRALDDGESAPRPYPPPRSGEGKGGGAGSMLIGSGPPPVAIRGRRSVASALERPEDFALAAGADPRKAITKKEMADD